MAKMLPREVELQRLLLRKSLKWAFKLLRWAIIRGIIKRYLNSLMTRRWSDPLTFRLEHRGEGIRSLRSNQELLIINLQGRTFLPPIDCPFRKVDEILEADKKNPFVFVDFHAEATSEKIAMGWHLDGKVSAVVGTHTHVQTNDNRVLPQGTAYVTDVGMVGPQEWILGVERNAVLQKFKTQLPVRFEGLWKEMHFHAVVIELNDQTGLAKGIKLIRYDEDQVFMD